MFIYGPNPSIRQADQPKRRISTQAANRRPPKKGPLERRRMGDRRRQQLRIRFKNRRSGNDRRRPALLIGPDLTPQSLQSKIGNTINTKI